MKKMRSILLSFMLLFCTTSSAEKVIIKLSPLSSFYSQTDYRENGRNNTIYEICYPFDLKGGEIILPKECKLLFNGGKLINGIIIGDGCTVESSATHIFDNIQFSGNWKNEEAYPEWFGAKGDGQADDTQAVLNFLNSGIGQHLLFKGKYLFNNSKLLTAQIDSVQIDGGEFICSSAGLLLTGDNVVIKNVNLHGRNKPSAQNLNYSHVGVSLKGNNNKIENVEVYNINSSGIRIGGKGVVINNVYSHDNQIGMVVMSNTRNITIGNSRFVDNNIVHKSGADGVLFQRTVSGVVMEHCLLENNGEHGVYFQGQNAMFRNNIVRNNTLDGLKFGSYDDGGFVYPEEKLNLWVKGADKVPGFNNELGGKGFGIANVTIEKNMMENNRGGDAIYFQPSATGIKIVDNEIHNNDITFSFFNYSGEKTRLEDINSIEVLANTLSGNSLRDGNPSRISISATSNVRIADNKCGRIGVNAPNKTTPPIYKALLKGCIIEGNNCRSISINRAENAIVKDNIMMCFSTNTNCVGLIVTNNNMTEQDKSIIFNVIKNFSRNEVMVKCDHLCYETETFSPLAPTNFDDNIISGVSSSSGVVRFYGVSGKVSSFKGNIFSCQNSQTPLVISSGKSISVTDNVVWGKGTKGSATVILSGVGINSKGNESNGRIEAASGSNNRSYVELSIIKKKVTERSLKP